MSRIYTVVADNVTVAGATSLIYIRPSSAQGVEVLECHVSQNGVSASAMQRIQLVTQAVSGTPAYTSYTTPLPYDKGNTQASAITGATDCTAGHCGINATTESSGSRSVLVPETFNVLNGFYWEQPEGSGIWLPAGYSSIFAIYFPAAPATLTGWTARLKYREV